MQIFEATGKLILLPSRLFMYAARQIARNARRRAAMRDIAGMSVYLLRDIGSDDIARSKKRS